MRLSSLLLGIIASALVSSGALAREQISIVGSSTVYPFATIAAEKFGQSSGFKTPVVEATGSGGGIKLFCAGIGLRYPDITNASRAIKPQEIDLCTKAGVEFQEFIVGNDGIAFANAVTAGQFDISIAHIAAALVAELPGGGTTNTPQMMPTTLKNWAEVDSFVAARMGTPKIGLPAIRISIMIPPPTSGTRDAMGALFMKAGWKKLGLESGTSKGAYKSLREDGRAIEVGENDSLIIEKLAADPDMFGVFGYSFFDQNRDKVQASILDGVELNFDTVASYTYPGARPLYFYVKKQHIGVVPGLLEFVEAFISEEATGIDGYLFPAGLVPLNEEDASAQMENLDAL